MSETREELETQLAQVNTAIQQVVSGTRLTRMEIGTGTFRRAYQYIEINLEMLQNLKNEILRKLMALDSIDSGMAFKNNVVQSVWRKGL